MRYSDKPVVLTTLVKILWQMSRTVGKLFKGFGKPLSEGFYMLAMGFYPHRCYNITFLFIRRTTSLIVYTCLSLLYGSSVVAALLSSLFNVLRGNLLNISIFASFSAFIFVVYLLPFVQWMDPSFRHVPTNFLLSFLFFTEEYISHILSIVSDKYLLDVAYSF